MATEQPRKPQDNASNPRDQVSRPRAPKPPDTRLAARPAVPTELIGLDVYYQDERKQILQDFAPDCCDKIDPETGRGLPQSSDFVAFFADPKDKDKHRRLAKMGYEPVTVDGSQIDHRGDVLYKIPRSVWKQRKAAIGKRSHAQATDSFEASDAVAMKEGFYHDE